MGGCAKRSNMTGGSVCVTGTMGRSVMLGFPTDKISLLIPKENQGEKLMVKEERNCTSGVSALGRSKGCFGIASGSLEIV